MIPPTIARSLHFYPRFDSAPDGEPFAAILAGVNADGTVNLGVFARDGSTYPVRDVRLVQDDEAAPAEGHYAAWMPYQKGQAQKTESAEGAAAGKLAELEQSTASRFAEGADKVAALEQTTARQFSELGAYLGQKFDGIEQRLTALTTPPAAPSASVPSPVPPNADGADQQS